MVHLTFDPDEWGPLTSMDAPVMTGSVWAESSVGRHAHSMMASPDWRDDLKKLFKVNLI